MQPLDTSELDTDLLEKQQNVQMQLLTWSTHTALDQKLWYFVPNSSSNEPLVRCSCSSRVCSIRIARCPIDIDVQSMVQHSMQYCCTIQLLEPNAHNRHSPTPNLLVVEWIDRPVCLLCRDRQEPATMSHANNLYCSSRIAPEYRPSMNLAQQTIRSHRVQCLYWLSRNYCSLDGPVSLIQGLSCTIERCSCPESRGQRAITYLQPIQRAQMVATFGALVIAAATCVHLISQHLFQTWKCAKMTNFELKSRLRNCENASKKSINKWNEFFLLNALLSNSIQCIRNGVSEKLHEIWSGILAMPI